MQATDDHADQPRHGSRDGPDSPGAGADTHAGAGQSQPTDDHADYANHGRDGGHESPGADADTIGGDQHGRGNEFVHETTFLLLQLSCPI
jgi:hypothetical protein